MTSRSLAAPIVALASYASTRSHISNIMDHASQNRSHISKRGQS
ncbi:hypothetical protein MPC1_6900002 [Methylocella tundrae]|nr:hypothetical protein MPC1_6900002 [Methylocella tundrae]